MLQILSELQYYLCYPTQNVEIELSFFFLKNYDVQVRCFSICNVPDNKIEEMYEILNELNCEYRWVTFFIDEDNDVNVKGDIFRITYNTASSICIDFAFRIMSIINDALPEIMKTRWS